jgi:hypothetical protein
MENEISKFREKIQSYGQREQERIEKALSLALEQEAGSSPEAAGIAGIGKTDRARLLAVCCASRVKPQKIADQEIFYPANCQRTPDNRDFWATGGTKINKCNRLLGHFAVLHSHFLIAAQAASLLRHSLPALEMLRISLFGPTNCAGAMAWERSAAE